MTPAGLPPFFPPRDLLPQPLTPWRLNMDLFNRISQKGSSDKTSKICEVLPSDPECQFILKYFMLNKPEKYAIKRVVCIHNPVDTVSFETGVRKLEQRCNDPTYSPAWRQEDFPSERAKVIERWKSFTEQFSPLEVAGLEGGRTDPVSRAQVLPLWHGSKKETCELICESGFTFFGKHHYFEPTHARPSGSSTDIGYFGNGIYFTNSAKYAATIYSQGHLILSWVSMREPYPVISHIPNPQRADEIIDVKKLMGREHYQNYSAHFIPVRAKLSGSAEYFPCFIGQVPECDEVVVFDSAHTLPRFWIELTLDTYRFMSPTSTAEDEYQMGLNLSKDSSTEDKARQAFAFFKTAAEKGHPGAQYELAECYFKGRGVSQNIEEGCQWSERANQIARDLMLMLHRDMQQHKIEAAKRQEKLAQTQNRVSQLEIELQQARAEIIRLQQEPPKPAPMLEAVIPQPLKPSSHVPSLAFGKEQWEKHFGDVGYEPPLPPNIEEILNARCPFWPGVLSPNKVKDTHILVLVPATVKGRPLTMEYLIQLVNRTALGKRVVLTTDSGAYRSDSYFDIKSSVMNSHWVLMQRNIIDTNRWNDSYHRLEDHCFNYKLEIKNFRSPTAIEASVGILMEYFRTGTRLFEDVFSIREGFSSFMYNFWHRSTYIGCVEHNQRTYGVAIGGFNVRSQIPQITLYTGGKYYSSRVYVLEF